jgi:hypothetical protein
MHRPGRADLERSVEANWMHFATPLETPPYYVGNALSRETLLPGNEAVKMRHVAS